MKRAIILFLILVASAIAANAQTPGTTCFPTCLDTDTTFPKVVDNKQTTLSANINSSVTTFTVSSTSGFPSPAVVWIASEQINCASVGSGTFSSCTRGANGTIATSHSGGDFVQIRGSQVFYEGVRGAVKAIEAKIGSGSGTPNSGGLFYGTGSGTSSWLPISTDGKAMFIQGGLPTWITFPGAYTAQINTFTVPQIIQSNSAQALTIGVNGATNPELKVGSNNTSSVNGLYILGDVSGAGATMQVISSATNEPMILKTKGTGTLRINVNGNIDTFTSSGGLDLVGALSNNGFTVIDGLGVVQVSSLPTVDVPHGGTGLTTLTNHGILIGRGSSSVAVTSTGAVGTCLEGNGGSADPSFITCGPIGSGNELQYRVNSTTFGAISNVTSDGTHVTSSTGGAFRLNLPQITNGLADSSGNTILGFSTSGTPVNWINIQNAPTGNPPIIAPGGNGTDASVGFEISGFTSTGTNTAGANTVIQTAQSTGNQPGGTFKLQLSPAGTSGSSLNTYVDVLAIDATRLSQLNGQSKIANTGVGSNLITSWVNDCSLGFTTFTSSGANISAATYTGGNFAFAQANATCPSPTAGLALTNGNTYKVSFTLTINSGAAPSFSITPSQFGGTPVQVSFVPSNGFNSRIFVANATNSYFAHFVSNGQTGIPMNFAVSGFTLTQIDATNGNLSAQGNTQLDGNLVLGGTLNVGGPVNIGSLTTTTFSNPLYSTTNGEVYGGNNNVQGAGSGHVTGTGMLLMGNSSNWGSQMDDVVAIGSYQTWGNAPGTVVIGESVTVDGVTGFTSHYTYPNPYGGPATLVGSHSWGTGTCVGFACVADGTEATVLGPQAEGHGLAVFVIGDAAKGFGTAASGGTGYTIGASTLYGNQFVFGDGNICKGYGCFLFGGGLYSTQHSAGMIGGGPLTTTNTTAGDHSFQIGSCSKSGMDALGGVRDDCALTFYDIYFGHGDAAGNSGKYAYPSPHDETINMTNASGSNNAGAIFRVRGSWGTGNAPPGPVIIATTRATSSGSTSQSYTDTFKVDGIGNVTALTGSWVSHENTVTGTGTQNLDFSLGNFQQFTFGAGTATLTFSNITSSHIVISVVQDSVGSRTITWPGTVKWVGGSAPTLSTGANKRDNFWFWSDGTNLYELSRALDVR